MTQEPPSVAKWSRWLARLRDEIHTLFLWRTTWRAIAQAIDANRELPRTHVFNFMAATYAASQAVAVRRLCGEQSGEVSFNNLLHEIVDNVDLIPDTRRPDPASVRADVD